MSNIIRTIVYLSVLFVLFSCAGYFFGGVFGTLVAIVFLGIFNILFYLYYDRIFIRMYRAEKADEDKCKTLYDLVKEVSDKAKVNAPDLYLVNISAPNILLVGKDMSHTIIMMSSGLIQLCTEKELEAVISREVAHIINDNVMLRTLSAVMGCFVLYPAEVLQWKTLSLKKELRALASVPAYLFAPFAALIVRAAVSSAEVFAIDACGAKLSKKPKYLASALEKISHEIKFRPLKFGCHATSHLFIINPFNGSALSRFFSISPPVKERMERLEKMSV